MRRIAPVVLLILATVRERRYGEDSLDPMLWQESEHLLAQPCHQVAVRVLDKFLRSHGQTLVRDPLNKAMLQRALWAVFDWSVAQNSSRNRPL